MLLYFCKFCNYLPLENGQALHLNKLESPSPKDALSQVWLKFAQWFWRRRFSNFVNVFSLFPNYLPLEKGGALHFNKLEFPLPKDALCQVLLKLAQWFWRRRFLNFVNVFSVIRKYLPLEKGRAFHLNKLVQWFWRRRFLNLIIVFLLFRNNLPFEKGGALHLYKLEFPLPKDALCQVWLKLAQEF